MKVVCVVLNMGHVEYIVGGETMISVVRYGRQQATLAALIQKPSRDENDDRFMPDLIDSLPRTRRPTGSASRCIALFLRDTFLETHGQKGTGDTHQAV
jgi:hypothetical protein